MALRQSQLNKIPLRNKDLAFGYVRECRRKNKSSIPQMIKYLCLLYLNVNKDKFDAHHSHKNNIIDGDTVISEEEYGKFNTYFENIVDKHVHIWKIKANSVYTDDMFGIIKVEDSPPRLSGWFDEGDRRLSVGYGMFLGAGGLSNPENCLTNGINNWSKPVEEEEIVSMRLDCNKWTLEYAINDTGYSRAFEIDPKYKYRAAFTLERLSWFKESSYTIVSYQEIY